MTSAKSGAELGVPTAIFELKQGQGGASLVPVSSSLQFRPSSYAAVPLAPADVVRFEMNREQLAAAVQQIDTITACITKYSS